MSGQPISCNHCLENFDDSPGLQNHIEEFHLKDDSKVPTIEDSSEIDKDDEKAINPVDQTVFIKEEIFCDSFPSEEFTGVSNGSNSVRENLKTFNTGHCLSFEAKLNEDYVNVLSKECPENLSEGHSDIPIKSEPEDINQSDIDQSFEIKVENDSDIPIKEEPEDDYHEDLAENLEQKPFIQPIIYSYETIITDKIENEFPADDISTEEPSKKFRKCTCRICHTQFNSKWQLSEHLKNVQHKSLECHICTKKLSSYGTFDAHIKAHTNSFKCSYCTRIFFTENGAKEHEKIHIDAQIQCEVCSQIFNRRHDLKKHMMKHTGEKPFKCTYCPKAFADKLVCQKHEKTHTGEKECECPHCHKKLTQSGLYRHLKEVHLGIKPHKCDICGKGLPSKSKLTIHLRVHNRPERVNKYFCDMCKKGFASKKGLSKHKRTEHKIIKADKISTKLLNKEKQKEMLKCEICSQEFTHQYPLKKHMMRKHTGEKPHKCKFCSKAFVDKQVCIRHERTHTGEKDTECPHCQKKLTASGLYRHLKVVHLGIRPHKCDICEKDFPTKPKLKLHLRTHQEPENGTLEPPVPLEPLIPPDMVKIEPLPIDQLENDSKT